MARGSGDGQGYMKGTRGCPVRFLTEILAAHFSFLQHHHLLCKTEISPLIFQQNCWIQLALPHLDAHTELSIVPRTFG